MRMAVGNVGSTPPIAAISTARNTHPVTTQMIVKGMVRARLRLSRGDKFSYSLIQRPPNITNANQRRASWHLQLIM